MTLTTAERIRSARAAAGWSQTRLAKETGIDQGNISKYERGEKQPTGTILDRIMSALATAGAASHVLAAVDGALGIQGRAEGLLEIIDVMADEVPVAWVAEGYVAKGCTTMVAGAAGAGKSYLTQTIGKAYASGDDAAAGMKISYAEASATVTDPDTGEARPAGRVLVIDAENGPNLVRSRRASLGMTAEQAANYIVAGAKGFCLYKDRAKLAGILADQAALGAPIDLIILDTWTSLWSGSENNADQVMACLGALNDIAAEHQVAILLIHHTGKDGEDARGSSAINGTISGGVFTFTRYDEKDNQPPEARRIECRKLRIAPEPHPATVYVTPHGITETLGG